MISTYSVQNLPKCERPRERLKELGPDSLSSAELIAIVLGSGSKNKSILQLAHEIMTIFGDVQQLSEATLTELLAIKGIGFAKAIQLKAALHLGIRAGRVMKEAKHRIEHPLHAYQLLKDELENEMRELFVTILQDSKGFVICHEIISIGSLSQTLVHPREVFYPAIRHKAASMIISHNHPSGDPTPSKQDLELTKVLVEAGQLMNIPVRDHIIVGRGKYVSLRQQGFHFVS